MEKEKLERFENYVKSSIEKNTPEAGLKYYGYINKNLKKSLFIKLLELNKGLKIFELEYFRFFNRRQKNLAFENAIKNKENSIFLIKKRFHFLTKNQSKKSLLIAFKIVLEDKDRHSEEYFKDEIDISRIVCFCNHNFVIKTLEKTNKTNETYIVREVRHD